MLRLIAAFAVSSIGVLLAGSTIPADLPPAQVSSAPRIESLPVITLPPAKPEPPRPLSPQEALSRGVLIAISLPSQRMFVFKQGQDWASSPVSTGRRGHATPPGVFPILQKRVRHRSNLYGNAPMPYMQRLTWDGVALHAGHLPGRPASHGCVRLPWNVARSLYAITDFTSTTVLVTRERVRSAAEARALVEGRALVPSGTPAAEEATVAAADGRVETIQLGASSKCAGGRGAVAGPSAATARVGGPSPCGHPSRRGITPGLSLARLRSTGPCRLHRPCPRRSRLPEGAPMSARV